MSDRPDSRNPRPRNATRLDAALREWPEAPSSESEWEERAIAIETRIDETPMKRGPSSERASSAGAIASPSGNRLGQSLKDVTIAKLLADPLPESEEDSHNSAAFPGKKRGAYSVDGDRTAIPESAGSSKEPSKERRMGMQHERERDRRSFQDLARLAGVPASKPSSGVSSIRDSSPDDSGRIDLRALSSDPGAVDRASVTPLASSPLIDDEPASVRAVPPLSGPISQVPISHAAVSQPLSGPISAPRGAVAAAAVPSTLRSVAPGAPAAAATPRSAFGRGAVVVLGLAAIAAGAFVAVRTLPRPGTADAVAIAPVAPQVANAPQAVNAPNAPQAVNAPATPAVAPVLAQNDTPVAQANGVDPAALPKPSAAARPSAKASSHGTPKDAKDTAEARNDEIPPGLAAAMGGTSAPKKPDAKLTAKDLPAPTTTGALNDAIKTAAAPAPQAEAPTAAAQSVAPAGSVAQRPSQGQVTGALGAVLPDARGCLGPDDPVSRARVIFSSDGAVQSITVTGFAAGKPAEACIKGAIGKAKVPPFAEASYGANVTIRP